MGLVMRLIRLRESRLITYERDVGMRPVVRLPSYARQPAGGKHCCQSGSIDWLHWFQRRRDDEISDAGRPVVSIIAS